jgi:hypothetical protein
MENVFLKQQIEELRRAGYVSFANPEFAREVMAALPRPEFEAVRYVNGTGRCAVEGFIFMPRARRTVTTLVKRDLREAEKNAASYRNALAELSR